MIPVFFSVLPIFLLIILGALTKTLRLELVSFWKISDKFVYYLFFPSLLILDISQAHFSTEALSSPLLATTGGTLGVAALIFLFQPFFKAKGDVFTSIFQGGTRYNSYVFIALSQSLFGSTGVALSGVFVAYMIVLTNILSVLVLNAYGTGTHKRGIGTSLLGMAQNPLILGALLGLVLNGSGVLLPPPVKQLMVYLGGAATPLSLMSVGAGLTLSLHAHKFLAVAYASTLKLLILPIMTFLILTFFRSSGPPAQIAMLYAAVPCAGNAYILARQMGGDAETMASIITWTTLLSILTITILFGIELRI